MKSQFDKIFEHASCYEERRETWKACCEWIIGYMIANKPMIVQKELKILNEDY